MNDILIAVKDDKLANLLSTACQDRGATATKVMGAPQALEELVGDGLSKNWTGLFIDLSAAQPKPLDLVAEILDRNPRIKILAFSRNADLKTATAILRAGAADFLPLPPDPMELSGALDKLLGRLSPKGKSKAKSQADPDRFRHIVGRSAALQRVFRLVDKVAATDSTVMIHGESGTGKELVARALHQNSPRADRPLIPVNCGAIPEELLEAELFGHEKGAFTNAIRTRVGRFEMADGSSIFLDEIGDMSPKLQVKLLRVLQEHEFERVGGDRVIKVDIRVITATHVDLAKAVEEGAFREDLYYRLNVIPVTMPPLRERLDDVPLLVDHFLARFRETRGSEVSGVSPEALGRLLAYGWPGNVRELENLVERMVTLAETEVLGLDDLPAKLMEATEGLSVPVLETPSPPDAPRPDGPPASAETPPAPALAAGWAFPKEGVDFNSQISALEDKLILGALAAAGGVKNQAAKLLGLNRTTLVEKMRKKGLGGDGE